MELKRQIEAKYGSIYKFCRATGLARSMVYQLVRGKYPGNAERQTARVLAYLGKNKADFQIERVYQTLKTVACSRCPDRDNPGPRCRGCLALFREQAQAVVRILED
ncbi:hypothetical protein [Desulfovulcanus sp.]